MKTLSTVLREQNITRRADILEFVRNSELVKKQGGAKLDSSKAGFRWGDSQANFQIGNTSIYASEILVVHSGGTSVENFQKKIKDLDKQIEGIKKHKAEIQRKIDFLKESGAEKFVKNEYRAYQAIQTMNKENLTDFEKAKVISDLIN